jgi:hypothetical protein
MGCEQIACDGAVANVAAVVVVVDGDEGDEITMKGLWLLPRSVTEGYPTTAGND